MKRKLNSLYKYKLDTLNPPRRTKILQNKKTSTQSIKTMFCKEKTWESFVLCPFYCNTEAQVTSKDAF